MQEIKIASFRPGVVSNGSAFEAQALIYKYIQRKYGWRFVIIKDERDAYVDPELEVISIPWEARQTFGRWPHLPRHSKSFKMHVLQKLKDFDIILGCDPTIYVQGILAAYAADKHKIPFAFDASLTNMGARRIGFGKYDSRIRWAVDVASLIWIPTPKTAERFRDIGLRSEALANKFVVLGHPVDIDSFRPNPVQSKDKRIILCVARLVMEKGIHYIIEAMAPLIKRDSSLILRIVGKGEAKGFLQRIARDAGIAANVEFLDPVPHAELPQLYNQAHIFVGHPVAVAEWEEFFGVVNIEAMACGLPVVTSRCGGISYMLRENDIALFVAERDIAGTTTAIQTLLDDQELYAKMGNRGRTYVAEKYSLPVIAEKYKSYLDTLLGKASAELISR